MVFQRPTGESAAWASSEAAASGRASIRVLKVLRMCPLPGIAVAAVGGLIAMYTVEYGGGKTRCGMRSFGYCSVTCLRLSAGTRSISLLSGSKPASAGRPSTVTVKLGATLVMC